MSGQPEEAPVDDKAAVKSRQSQYIEDSPHQALHNQLHKIQLREIELLNQIEKLKLENQIRKQELEHEIENQAAKHRIEMLEMEKQEMRIKSEMEFEFLMRFYEQQHKFDVEKGILQDQLHKTEIESEKNNIKFQFYKHSQQQPFSFTNCSTNPNYDILLYNDVSADNTVLFEGDTSVPTHQLDSIHQSSNRLAAIINTINTSNISHIEDVNFERVSTMTKMANVLLPIKHELQSLKSISISHKLEKELLQQELMLCKDEKQMFQEKLIMLERQYAVMKNLTTVLMTPPPALNDRVITEFKPGILQWELTLQNIDRISPYGETILPNYCKYIDSTPLEVFRLLIETYGDRVNLQDINIAIRAAFENCRPGMVGDCKIITYLLLQDCTDVNLKGQNDLTLFHWACLNINKLSLDTFKCLIEMKSAGLNILDKDNNTPIHYALQKFNPKDSDPNILTYLLDQNGIDKSLKDSNNRSILHLACININSLALDTFKNLIEIKCFDLNALDQDHMTPIHVAFNHFKSGDGDILTYLLSQEAIDVKNKGLNGRDLLHWASLNISALPINVFKHLIETKRMDVNQQDEQNNTPIHIALENFDPSRGNINTLMYLLTQNSIDLKIKGFCEYNFLHSACYNNNALPLSVFQYLIEIKCVSIDDCTPSDNSPFDVLMLTISTKDDSSGSQIAEYLIQKGAKINQKTARHQTPLDIFFSRTSPQQHPLTYQVLIQNGAKRGY
jgi:ankyrin repeat protein